MRTSKFSDEQIIGIRKEAEAGAAVTDVCRRHGISGHTFYCSPSSRCAGSQARRQPRLDRRAYVGEGA